MNSKDEISPRKDELKCVWMTAGVVSYKLCCKEYDCDRCEYDSLIKNRSHMLTDVTPPVDCNDGQTIKDHPDRISLLVDKLLNITIDKSLHFSPNHLWMKIDNSGLVEVGIDNLACSLLSYIKSIVLLPAGNEIKRNQTFNWVVQDGWTSSFYSPLSGIVEQTNPILYQHPDTIKNGSVDDNWLVKIKPSMLAAEIKNYLSDRSAEKWHKKELNKVKTLLVNKINELLPLDRATQYEGGKFITTLSEALPKEEYFKITDSIFKQVSF
jgi:glycine cleavage system H protein